MDILDRIKTLAKTRDLSINSLEEKLGFARGYLYTWKKKTPGVDRVEKVADYFNVTTDYLLGRTSDPHLQKDGLSQNQKRIAYSIDPDISDEEREAIISIQ